MQQKTDRLNPSAPLEKDIDLEQRLQKKDINSLKQTVSIKSELIVFETEMNELSTVFFEKSELEHRGNSIHIALIGIP